MSAGQREEILRRLTSYVRQELLREQDDGVASELRADSPLLEWGVLNSMNTARLISFLREELAVEVPPTHITGRHFHSLNTVTDLVLSLPKT
ncbi:phosphopantetheine-binding protein [Micromonospora sp. NPDC007271]|uniref:phosphopantetheine-binding protein n=1 Tax=Micromonospora sp. NPDC007271 TaxID=3154587 RepID=UPI0034000300